MADQIPVNLNETYGPRSGSTASSSYRPTDDDFLIDIDVDFVTRPITPVIHLVQYDYELPVLAFHLYSNRSARALPSNCVASIRINNGNGTVYVDNASGVSADRTTVYFKVDPELCVSPGFKPGVIELSNSQGLINSSPFSVEIEQNPVQQGDVESDESYISLVTLLDETEKWREDGSPHLTNNSYIVTGKASATDVGNNATAEGYNNTVSGVASHAEGTNNSIASTGIASHAEGNNNAVSNDASHVEGYNNTASGSSGGAHAEGGYTTASAQCAHVEGFNNVASGVASHAEGFGLTGTSGNQAIGIASHTEGYNNIARANGSHAEGRENEITATGLYSHAEGSGNTVSGEHAHAQGNGNTASGNYAHAGGTSCTASGAKSHASGEGCTAAGVNSFAHGLNIVASRDNMAAFGSYNENRQNSIFEIGDGSDPESTGGVGNRNILTIDNSGHIEMNTLNAIGEVPSGEKVTNNNLAELLCNTSFPTVPWLTVLSGETSFTKSYDLRPSATIDEEHAGTFTYTTTISNSAFESVIQGKTLRWASGNPIWYPTFRVTRIWNTETGTDRNVIPLTMNYAIDNADPTSGFDVTFTIRVYNLSKTAKVANDVKMKIDVISFFKLMTKTNS